MLARTFGCLQPHGIARGSYSVERFVDRQNIDTAMSPRQNCDKARTARWIVGWLAPEGVGSHKLVCEQLMLARAFGRLQPHELATPITGESWSTDVALGHKMHAVGVCADGGVLGSKANAVNHLRNRIYDDSRPMSPGIDPILAEEDAKAREAEFGPVRRALPYYPPSFDATPHHLLPNFPGHLRFPPDPSYNSSVGHRVSPFFRYGYDASAAGVNSAFGLLVNSASGNFNLSLNFNQTNKPLASVSLPLDTLQVSSSVIGTAPQATTSAS